MATKRGTPKAIGERALYFIVRLLFWAIRLAPLRSVPFLGTILGVTAFCSVFGKPRRIAYNNMRIVFGSDISWLAKRVLLLRSFISATQGILVTCLADRLDDRIEGLFHVRGEKNLIPFLEKGQGIVLSSIHMGAFMLTFKRLSKLGLEVHYTVRRPKNEKIAGLLMGFMTKNGVRFIEDKPKHRSALENLRALKSGGAIVLMTDMKHNPEDGVWTEFFGHKVLSFSGGAVLAKRAGAPIIPMVTYKEAGVYTIEFFPPIFPKADQSPSELVQDYSAVLEQEILKRPAQWWWFHDRFRGAVPIKATGPFQRSLPLRTRVFLSCGLFLYRLLYLSLRVRVVDEFGRPWNRSELPKPAIYAGWHSGQAIIPGFLGGLGTSFLVSKSKDGEVFARVVKAMGGKVVRGSFQRDGSRALVELVRLLRDGGSTTLSPDAPRGPRCVAKEGVAYMSLKTGAPVVPFGIFAKTKVVFKKSWDQTWIPLPFSKVMIVVGRPMGAVSSLLGTQEALRESLRMKVEVELNALQAKAQEYASHQRLFSKSWRGVGGIEGSLGTPKGRGG